MATIKREFRACVGNASINTIQPKIDRVSRSKLEISLPSRNSLPRDSSMVPLFFDGGEATSRARCCSGEATPLGSQPLIHIVFSSLVSFWADLSKVVDFLCFSSTILFGDGEFGDGFLGGGFGGGLWIGNNLTIRDSSIPHSHLLLCFVVNEVLLVGAATLSIPYPE